MEAAVGTFACHLHGIGILILSRKRSELPIILWGTYNSLDSCDLWSIVVDFSPRSKEVTGYNGKQVSKTSDVELNLDGFPCGVLKRYEFESLCRVSL